MVSVTRFIQNGLKDGFGEWIHPDGDNYRGKFKAGIKRGKGVYTLKMEINIKDISKEIKNMG